MTIERRWDNRRVRLESFGTEPNSRRENGTGQAKARYKNGVCQICHKPIAFEKTLWRHLVVDHSIVRDDLYKYY